MNFTSGILCKLPITKDSARKKKITSPKSTTPESCLFSKLARMRPKNPELLKHKQRKQNVQLSLQAVGSAFELGQELLQLLQPQAQPCTPSGGSCLALALASRLFFCNINERENVLVARTGKSWVCAGPRAEQLQQHLCCYGAVMVL